MVSTPYATTDSVYYGTSAPTAFTNTLATALATTVLSAAFTGMWAFSSSTAGQLWRTRINQAKVDIGTLKTLVNSMRTQLINIGIYQA
jgi:hypothetical protein